MGWPCQNCICEEKQNTQCSFQVSTRPSPKEQGQINLLIPTHGIYHHHDERQSEMNPFNNNNNIVNRRSTAVEQLLEKNYKIHCSVQNVVSTSIPFPGLETYFIINWYFIPVTVRDSSQLKCWLAIL